ncbi:hypothetical protein Tco_0810107 [Tanacetum coccineum]
MPLRRARNINDVYERIMARMEERLDQFVDQFANRMNDMMITRSRRNNNGKVLMAKTQKICYLRVTGYLWFAEPEEWVVDGVAPRRRGDHDGVSDDDYEEAPVFDDDQFEKESMPIYDTDIEDVIKEETGFVRKGGFGGEEDNIEDVVVVANDLCSSMIQTTLNVDFEEDINTKSHELISFGKKYSYQG